MMLLFLEIVNIISPKKEKLIKNLMNILKSFSYLNINSQSQKE